MTSAVRSEYPSRCHWLGSVLHQCFSGRGDHHPSHQTGPPASVRASVTHTSQPLRSPEGRIKERMVRSEWQCWRGCLGAEEAMEPRSW